MKLLTFMENESEANNDFSYPTYEVKPNVRISFDEYEEEEEEEEYEEDWFTEMGV